jgi:hypothetical protein
MTASWILLLLLVWLSSTTVVQAFAPLSSPYCSITTAATAAITARRFLDLNPGTTRTSMTTTTTTDTFAAFMGWSSSSVRSNTRLQDAPTPRLYGNNEDDDDDEEDEDDEDEDDGGNAISKEGKEKKNPYADPNYPQLEFVDYSDPSYQVDQGISDEFFASAAANSESMSMGMTSSSSDGSSTATTTTEEMLEEMREERRRKNDEFQFQTYFTKVLRGGKDEYKGEWTVYRTSTFLPPQPADALGTSAAAATADNNNNMAGGAKDEHGFPRLVKAARTLPVISRGYKITVNADDCEQELQEETSEQGTLRLLDLERIIHHERIASHDEAEDSFQSWQDDLDTDSGFGRQNLELLVNDNDNNSINDNSNNKQSGSAFSDLSAQALAQDQEILAKRYWPKELAAKDFRGHQGIMCVGNAYTICTAVALHDENDNDENTPISTGPFSEYRAEIGIQSKQLRFRIKFDYAILEKDKKKRASSSSSSPPPLHLRTLTICRETLERWPPRRPSKDGNNNGNKTPTKFRSLADRAAAEALFGKEGAEGGLYDPPPVGSDERASKYMMLDLEGRATTLFPYIMEQTNDNENSNDSINTADQATSTASTPTAAATGWVMTLDWTPGSMRYQVDRKVCGGEGLLGLRTLELSEVQSMDAEQYRPRDGGSNMRQ